MNYLKNWKRESYCHVVYKEDVENQIECKCSINSHGRIDWIEVEGEQVNPNKFRELGISHVFYANPVFLQVG